MFEDLISSKPKNRGLAFFREMKAQIEAEKQASETAIKAMKAQFGITEVSEWIDNQDEHKPAIYPSKNDEMMMDKPDFKGIHRLHHFAPIICAIIEEEEVDLKQMYAETGIDVNRFEEFLSGIDSIALISDLDKVFSYLDTETNWGNHITTISKTRQANVKHTEQQILYGNKVYRDHHTIGD